MLTIEEMLLLVNNEERSTDDINSFLLESILMSLFDLTVAMK